MNTGLSSITTLAQARHLFGFEGTLALSVFTAGVAIMVLIALVLVRANVRLWLVGGMFFFACLSFSVKETGLSARITPTWMLPVQLWRSELYLACGAMLGLVAMMRAKELHLGEMPFQGVMFLLIGLLAGFLRFFHEGAVPAIQSIGFVLGTVLTIIVALPAVLRGYDDCLRLLRVIMLASIAWAACCSIQLVIDPQAMLASNAEGGRFMGMTGNAQFAAVQCGVWSVIALWLLLNDPLARLRLVWLGLVAINVIFTGWTGSRMGGLILLVGSMFVLRSRIGRAVLFLPLAALATLLLFQLSEGLKIGENLARFTSLEDTRTHAYWNLIYTALENPIIGRGFWDAGASENSYLLGVAAYGFGMGVLLLILLLGSIGVMLALWRDRRRLPPEQRPIVDLIVGVNAALFLAAFFDGMLVSRIGAALMIFLTFSCLALRIRSLERSEEAWSPEDEGVEYFDQVDEATLAPQEA